MATPPGIEARIRRLALANALAHGGAPKPGPILSRLLSTDSSLRPKAAEVGRTIAVVVAQISRMPPEAQRKELDELGGPEPEGERTGGATSGDFPALPDAIPGKVVLRLAPFPSGALHIGNARMLFVNDYYRERYGAKLLLVFDDTIGSEKKRIDAELFDVIQHDLELCGIKPDQVLYKSDRIPSHYPWARRVIEKGAAYVCHCSAEVLRENRRRGIACAHRSQTVERTLAEWEGMLEGRYAAGQVVLRLRTDMADPDPAFRDRVLFRISDVDHPRVGRRYRVWPLLEFSWAVDDIELGITHVLRGKDLVMEDRMERYIWDLLGVRGPPFLHWGLLMIREAKISKSKSYLEVKSGLFDGWADPRTWSIASLHRRGITSEALRRFTLSFGLSLADIEVPAETLYAENRSIIDPITPRRAFVARPVRLEITGFPADLKAVELSNHPDRPELGRRKIPVSSKIYLGRTDVERHAGEEVRLKELVNVQLSSPIANSADSTAAKFTSRENRKLPRIQWVPAKAAVEVDVLNVDGSHTKGLGEATLLKSSPGDVVQFERVGFVRLEETWTRGSEPVRVCFGHP